MFSPVAAFTLLASSISHGNEPIDFNRDIRPILSENCFHCHGPDAGTRKADFRLDEEHASRADLGGYAAIVPGEPGESELWWRVTSTDASDQMPPPESNRHLDAKQKDLLKRWIESGAEYDLHWAYKTPVQLEGTIDNFVEDIRARRGLPSSPEAEKGALLRRVSLDLIGLPPSPGELHAFLTDDSPGAYERVVTRLLASPRFGEKWARSWLDLARYADSNGFQADQLRDSWAYRDWVIEALNTGMPFDQFTIEQLAGDLLPDATLDQKIATGFHRTVTCNVEAGVHPEQNRVNQVVDRVNTTGTVWLGVTMECAQCHDHKYDPFTMKDYYGLFAYFNNTPVEVRNPSGQGVSFDFYGPKMDLPLPPARQEKRAALQAQKKQLEADRARVATSLDESFTDWVTTAREALGSEPDWRILEVTSFSARHGESFERREDGSLFITGDVPDKTSYSVTARIPEGRVGAIRLEMLSDPKLPAGGPARGNGNRPNAILTELVVTSDGGEIALVDAMAGFSQKDWDVAGAIDGDPKTGWAINPRFGEDHWAVFETAPHDVPAGAEWRFQLDQDYGGGRVIGRLRLAVAEFAPADADLPESIRKILAQTGEKRSKKDEKELRQHYEKEHPDLKELDRGLARLDAQLKKLEPDSTLVMVEMEEPRETRIMKRGNYLDPGDKVEAATPDALHPVDPSLPRNRLGLAKWLMDPANPLTARVTVNRIWAEIFGIGIVRTLEDFGTQAEPPTHPELLDWLATEFVQSGWDMKHVIEQIVLSETYRQDSRVSEEALALDPENRYFTRGPRFRLSAEAIRDQALASSGLLSTKMTGEPIMPHQPAGIWRQVGRNEPKWIDARNEDRFRRGIYVVWRRAAPFPSFVNFDAPDRSSCVVSRPRTNTPLQALTLLNDPAYTEMALGLAQRVLSDRPDASLAERIEYAYERVLSRLPTPEETDHLTYLAQNKMARFADHPDEADQVIAGNRGILEGTDGFDSAELAAWFFVANVLLNLDETVTKG